MKKTSTQLTDLPEEILVHLASFFSSHEQVCQLASINSQFRDIVHQVTLPKNLDLTIPNQLHHDSIFQKYPIESVKLVHAMRYALLPIWDDIDAPWILAAFAGNLPATQALLGDDLITTKQDETEMGIVHFSARGGQTDMLKAIKDQYGQQALEQQDSIGHNALMLACMGLHANCMAWIMTNTRFSLLADYNVGGMTYHCLDLFKEEKLPAHFVIKLALMLTDNMNKLDNFQRYSTDTIQALTQEYIEERQTETLTTLAKQISLI